MAKEVVEHNIVIQDAKKVQKTKASHKFIIALAFVSIVGFMGIVSETLFALDISFYVEALWMIIIGLGLFFEAQPSKLKTVREQGLTSRNFTSLITIVIGLLAILAGILSLPFFNIQNPSFLAVKGILSVIAIIIIVIQTWIIE